MKNVYLFFVPLSRVLMLAVPLMLSACGGGGSSNTSSLGEVESAFSGSVGDGPIVGATVKVYDKDHNLIQTVISDASANYSTRIKIKGSAYPLTIEVEDGTDLVTGLAPDFKLVSVVIRPSVKYVNINPFSTLIVEAARTAPGGLSEESVSTAHSAIMRELNFGLDPLVIVDPIGTQITDSNVANLIKASEALGEMIRRVRDQMMVSGTAINGNDIVAALADDVFDGAVDGVGGSRASPRISAVSKLASAQVLIEALSNNLKVQGAVVTSRLDDAIAIAQPAAGSGQLTGSVRINREMLEQARKSVYAAWALVPSIELSSISGILDSIQVNSLPAEVERVLPGDSSIDLEPMITSAVLATDEELAAVNNANQPEPPAGGTDPVNNGPVISGNAQTIVNEGVLYSFKPTARDPDGDSLVFSISGRPSWATFSTSTGRLSGTPGANSSGSYRDIVISVSDGVVSTSLPAFSIVVNVDIPSNTAPTILGSPASSVAEDSAYVFQPNAFDADGDKLTFSISNRPAWASFNTGTGRLSGTPGNGDVGTYTNVIINVSDGSASASTGVFNITVINTNDAPTIGGSPAPGVVENSAYGFRPGVFDADGDKLTFNISNRPLWAGFNSSTGRLSGTPAQGNAGVYSNIVISVSDGTETAVLPAFSIRVDAVAVVNSSPVINGTPTGAVVAANNYNFQPSATDADGDPLTFGIANKPVWASFNTATGKLSGTPVASNQGSYGNIVISVSDGTDLVSLAAFSIRVDAAVSGTRVATGLVAYYPFTEGAGSLVADQSGNGTPMNLTVTGSVNWLGGGSGVMMNGGRVGTSGAATKMIDALRLSNTSTLEVWVKPANLTQSGPTRMISLASGTSQQNFMIGQVGSGVEVRLMHEGKDLIGQPYLKTGNGVLGTSPIHLVHTYDGAVERLYVNGVQRSETVAIGGAYGNWDVAGLFSVGNEAGSDRPYAGVIYLAAVYDRPLGAAEIQQNFSAGPGNTGNSGGSNPVNTAPVINGSPAVSVLSGNSYSFQPNATDADGDSLAFSISNKPAWASFDVATGRLSGIPSGADAGTYGNILISVTDGVGVVGLPAFSIQVDATSIQTGSFTLSWTAPTSRADGTSLSLSEIAGYRIYYGVSPGSYPNSIDVSNAAQTKVVNNLLVGTYYVVVTTRDTGSRESAFSQMITKVAQ